MNPDVIFVGAGPVGLWTAIQLKLHSPDLKILMLEKYQMYQRHHMLVVDESSFTGTINHPEFQTMISQFVGKVSTSKLEAVMLSFAKSIGITVQHINVTECNMLSAQYPDARVIVGSDGSHSAVRKQIFGNNMDVNYNLQYLVNVTYEIANDLKNLSWSEWAETLTRAHFYIKEYDEQIDGCKTKITLRMFIDPETYESVKDATFKNPFNMMQVQQQSPALYDTINLWLSCKRNFVAEQVISEPQITAVHLNVYKSKDVVKRVGDISWCLVGDSAFGVPFFRALNDGMLSGTVLALKISEYLSPQPNGIVGMIRDAFKSSDPLKEYQQYFDTLASQEMILANVKSKAMESTLSATYGSAVMSSYISSMC